MKSLGVFSLVILLLAAPVAHAGFGDECSVDGGCSDLDMSSDGGCSDFDDYFNDDYGPGCGVPQDQGCFFDFGGSHNNGGDNHGGGHGGGHEGDHGGGHHTGDHHMDRLAFENVDAEQNDGANDRSANLPTLNLDTDFTDWIGWVPWPKFDYTRRRAIIQLQHPEDRMYYSKKNHIFPGSVSNPHLVTDDRTVMFGISLANSNVATFGGFGPGLAYYFKADKTENRRASSYAEAYESESHNLPKTFQDIENWPVGTSMTFGSTHYGQLVFMAGAFFHGIDLGLLAKRGFTINIARDPKKFTISFSTKGTIGAKAGVFATPFVRANAQIMRHRIYVYTFMFSLVNPSQDAINATNLLLSKHKLDEAMRLGNLANSGVKIVSEKKETQAERNGRASIGFPVLARYNKAQIMTRSIAEKQMNGESHEIHQVNHIKLRNTKVIRKRRPNSGEPRVIHNQNYREKVATATINWRLGVGPKLSGKISYLREFDKIDPLKLNESVNELGKKLFINNLAVTFPPEVQVGAAILKLDLILEQGSVYRLINLARKNPDLFREKTKEFLRAFIDQNKTDLNPFFDPVKGVATKKAEKAYLETVKNLETIIQNLKDCRPRKHGKPEFEKERKEDALKLSILVKLISKNPLILVALKGLETDLVKYHYELMGEHFNPYLLNF